MVPRGETLDAPHSKELAQRWDGKTTTEAQSFSDGGFPPPEKQDD